jgi:hypothetical protein
MDKATAKTVFHSPRKEPNEGTQEKTTEPPLKQPILHQEPTEIAVIGKTFLLDEEHSLVLLKGLVKEVANETHEFSSNVLAYGSPDNWTFYYVLSKEDLTQYQSVKREDLKDWPGWTELKKPTWRYFEERIEIPVTTYKLQLARQAPKSWTKKANRAYQREDSFITSNEYLPQLIGASSWVLETVAKAYIMLSS